MKVKLVPAIDLIEGRCSRLEQGRFDTVKNYPLDPLEFAKKIEDTGTERIHIVDLDGAKAGAIGQLSIAEKIASQTGLIVDFGGGIRSYSDVENCLNAGVALVTIGSLAFKDKELFLKIVSDFQKKIILSLDYLDHVVKISGWEISSGMNLLDAVRLTADMELYGYLCTDISRDGMLGSPDFDTYSILSDNFASKKFIASGGISSYEDLIRLKSDQSVSEIIIGKALYEGKISLEELRDFNNAN